MAYKKRPVTTKKAKTILREGEIGGRKLTTKQERFFGFMAGGGTPTKVGHKRRKK